MHVRNRNFGLRQISRVELVEMEGEGSCSRRRIASSNIVRGDHCGRGGVHDANVNALITPKRTDIGEVGQHHRIEPLAALLANLSRSCCCMEIAGCLVEGIAWLHGGAVTQ